MVWLMPAANACFKGGNPLSEPQRASTQLRSWIMIPYRLRLHTASLETVMHDLAKRAGARMIRTPAPRLTSR